MYKIEINKTAIKQANKLPVNIWKRIKAKIYDLAINPFLIGYKNLRDQPGYYRIRIGDYRVIYHVAEEIKIITIRKIGHRKDIYSRS